MLVRRPTAVYFLAPEGDPKSPFASMIVLSERVVVPVQVSRKFQGKMFVMPKKNTLEATFAGTKTLWEKTIKRGSGYALYDVHGVKLLDIVS